MEVTAGEMESPAWEEGRLKDACAWCRLWGWEVEKCQSGGEMVG